MTPEERLERLNLFLVMANQLPSAKNTIDNILRVVRKYDLPKHVDREFIFDCLIAYYQSTEEYENCAELLKYKLDVDRKKRITVKKSTNCFTVALSILKRELLIPKRYCVRSKRS